MPQPDFPVITISTERLASVVAELAVERVTVGPVVGADGRCRLLPFPAPRLPAHAALPFLSLKKLLLPDGEPLWHRDGDGYRPPDAGPRYLAVGIAPCDLQALAYLDRVFADDACYGARRRQLLIVGAPCEVSAGCFCRPDGVPVGGDLFWDGRSLWALSPAGERIVAGIAAPRERRPLPQPAPPATMTGVTAACFLASRGAPLWDEAAARCLACGACSAVCPTCYCFEVLDRGDLAGGVTRQRVWDNCFFADHARVAGGHDFRPGRGQRLRFRFEHKRLGFGALRGLPSCVGCGRCVRACPVGIDLEPVARRLAEEEL